MDPGLPTLVCTLRPACRERHNLRGPTLGESRQELPPSRAGLVELFSYLPTVSLTSREGVVTAVVIRVLISCWHQMNGMCSPRRRGGGPPWLRMTSIIVEYSWQEICREGEEMSPAAARQRNMFCLCLVWGGGFTNDLILGTLGRVLSTRSSIGIYG